MTIRACCFAHPRYTTDCDDCRSFARAYERRRAHGVKDGTWEPLVEGDELERVRVHAAALVAAAGGPQVARVAGVSNTAIYKLINGLQIFLRPATAQALEGLSLERLMAAVRPTHVDLVGVSRRLQALACDQWGSLALSGLTGYNRISIGKWRVGTHYKTINVEARDRLVEVYDKIQGMADPLGPDVQVATQARKLGYLPPERWDEDTIDDPDAQPLPVADDGLDMVELRGQRESAMRLRTPGAGASWPREFKRATADLARQQEWPLADIAAVLGMSTSGVEYLLNGRKDRPHTRR